MEIAALEVDWLKASMAQRKGMARYKAGAYIWVAACLEAYIKAFVPAVVREINESSISATQLRPSLLTLLFDDTFKSIQNKSGIDMWIRRVELMQSISDGGPVSFKNVPVPTDGGTVRPKHLETLWKVFGFKGEALVSPVHRMALTEVADWRNYLAHGSEDPVKFGLGKTATDVVRMVTKIEDIVIHVDQAGRDYIVHRRYRR